MPTVKSIKLIQTFFDEPLIILMEKEPNGDSLVIIWIRILLLNAENKFNDRVIKHPNIIKYLSTKFNSSENIIKQTIDYLSHFKVIDFTNEYLKVSHPEKWYILDRECIVYEKIDNVKRNYILTRDNFICSYCGKQNSHEVDHIFPKSRGGSSDENNLTTACKHCNSSKKDKTPEEWIYGKTT